jgi:glucose/arabinose dehydrogenase
MPPESEQTAPPSPGESVPPESPIGGPVEHPVPPPNQSRRLKLIIFIAILILLLAGGLAWWLTQHNKEKTEQAAKTSTQPQPAPVSTETPTYDTSVVLAGRQHVWEIAFLPTKEMIFTERGGAISMLKDGQVSELGRVPDVFVQGEGGLMGLAVDPNFKTSRNIFVCYNSTTGDIRVARWHVADDLKSLTSEKAVMTGMPGNTTTFPGRHSGCRLAFGPDQYLWVGTGDSAQGDNAIRPDSLGGKILRIDQEGTAAKGNLGGSFDARIYSYGHRNVQGLAFFPATKNGALGLSTEHGPTEDDEVNEIKPGNFGWAPEPAGYNEKIPMTDLTRFPDAHSAIWSSGTPTQAPSGATILHGQAWKGWDGALAMAMLKGQHLKILRTDTHNKVTKEEKIFEGTYGRLRAVTQGPDGSLYIGSSNGSDDKIIKVTPK